MAQEPDQSDGGGGGSAAPAYIYFYYVTASRDGKHPWIEASAHKRAGGSLENDIQRLITDAREGAIKPSGWAMGDIRWRHRSHIVVAVDDGESESASVHFANSGPVDHDKTFTHRTSTDVGGVPVWHCVNEHKKKDGSPWRENDWEDFIVTLAVHSNAHGVEKRMFGHNDTGTNTGPP